MDIFSYKVRRKKGPKLLRCGWKEQKKGKLVKIWGDASTSSFLGFLPKVLVIGFSLGCMSTKFHHQMTPCIYSHTKLPQQYCAHTSFLWTQTCGEETTVFHKSNIQQYLTAPPSHCQQVWNPHISLNVYLPISAPTTTV